jgi:prepilin-type N-terminal cleavage/methylation domain-containing protein
MAKNCGQRGFSLIEILVAVTIMGLAYVAILQNFSMSARSIASMEEGRTTTLASALDFEKTLLSLDQADQKADKAGEILAEGAVYQLTQVTDENDEFMTLKLKKK